MRRALDASLLPMVPNWHWRQVLHHAQGGQHRAICFQGFTPQRTRNPIL